MRRELVSTVWLMIGVLVVLGLAVVSTRAGDDAAQSAGQEVFLAQKCNICHSVPTVGIESKVKSEKMKGPDLIDLAKQHDAEGLAKYLRREIQLNDADHKKEFKGTDEELQAIVDWLLEQKTDG